MTTAEKRKASVRETGAKAGDILIGYFPINQRLRIKIGSDQQKGTT